jgi:hypothetical protein
MMLLSLCLLYRQSTSNDGNLMAVYKLEDYEQNWIITFAVNVSVDTHDEKSF